jgi:hypothetical protein
MGQVSVTRGDLDAACRPTRSSAICGNVGGVGQLLAVALRKPRGVCVTFCARMEPDLAAACYDDVRGSQVHLVRIGSMG